MRRNKLLQAIVVLVGAFCLFRFGIRPPMPNSVLSLYMAITLMAVLVYVSSDADSWRAFVTPLWRVLTEPRPSSGAPDPRRRDPAPRRVLRLFPGLRPGRGAARASRGAPGAARHRSASAGRRSTSSTPTPRSGRTSRQNPGNRAKHLAAGAAIYIRNCVYCHGDLLDGQGHFASGFNPQPADFVGPNTIAQLAEGYVFWRIAKGGPGLPKESTPWNSAMPAWEDRLTEEQIWQVVYYLYETTGHPPRVMGSHASRPPEGARPPGSSPGARPSLGPRPAAAQSGDVALGKAVYEKRCAGCHGEGGKGDGPAAELLLPRPRDFTAGKYKIRTTAGALASDQDLLRIVTDGMPGTSMPPWRALPEKERTAVVAYIKTFAEAYKGAKLEPVAGTQGGLLLGGVDPAGQEDVRRLRVRQVPRPGRARRPGPGVGSQGRLGASDPAG